MSRERLVKSVALMMAATLVGKALYLIREPIIAAYFGASAQTDAYNVAMTIITMLLGVTISPIASILVPVYVEQLHDNETAGRRFIQQVLTLYLLILSSILVVSYFAAPWLIELYAPGFAPETALLAVRLTRILALFALVSGLGGYFSAVLTAHHSFFWVALGPIVTATVVILVLMGTTSELGVQVLAWGIVAGNTVEALVLGFAAVRRTVRVGLDFHLREVIKAIGTLSGWMLIGRFIGQGNEWIDRNVLSRFSTGSIAALGFARSIYMLPFEVFTTGITRVIIADFSWDVARQDFAALKNDLSLSIRMAGFFMIPINVGLAILSGQITQLFYEHGAFDAYASQVTASILRAFSFWLFFDSLSFILVRAYIALKYLRVSAVIGLLTMLAHWGFSFLLVPAWGVEGIVWAHNIPRAFGFIASLAYLRYKIGPLGLQSLAKPLAYISGAATIMGGIAYLGGQLTAQAGNTWLAIIWLCTTVLVGAGAYFLILYAVRFPDLRLVTQMIAKFIRRQGSA